MRGVPWLPRSTQPSCRRRSLEDAVDLAIPDGLPQQLPAAGDEERRLGRGCAHGGRAAFGSAPVPRRRSGAAAPGETCRTCSAGSSARRPAGPHRHRAGPAPRRCAAPCRRSARTASPSPPGAVHPGARAAWRRPAVRRSRARGRRAASSGPALGRRRLRRAPRWPARTAAAKRVNGRSIFSRRAEVARSPWPPLAWRAQAAIRSTVSGPRWPALVDIARRSSPVRDAMVSELEAQHGVARPGTARPWPARLTRALMPRSRATAARRRTARHGRAWRRSSRCSASGAAARRPPP